MCIYIYIYIYIYSYTYIHIYLYIHSYICIYVYVGEIFTWTFTNTYIYIDPYTYIYTHNLYWLEQLTASSQHVFFFAAASISFFARTYTSHICIDNLWYNVHRWYSIHIIYYALYTHIYIYIYIYNLINVHLFACTSAAVLDVLPQSECLDHLHYESRKPVGHHRKVTLTTAWLSSD